MATSPDDAPRHTVLRELAVAREALAAVNAATCWSLPDDDTRAALVEAARLQAVARATYLKLLAESAGRDVSSSRAAETTTDDDVDRPVTAVPASAVRPAAETCTWLAAQVTMSAPRVRADLREAKALDPDTGDLRAMGSQLAAGAITAEHAAIGVRALTHLPARVVRERRDEVDTLLSGHAARFAPPITRILARHLLQVICPDQADRFDTEAHLRRELRLGVDSTGVGILRGQLEGPTLARLKAVLDHLAAPHRGTVHTGDDTRSEHETGTQSELTVNDLRTPAQRLHDALDEMTRLAAGALRIGVRAGEPPRVVVHTTPEQIAAARGGAKASGVPSGASTCEQTGPLSAATLAVLACDAVTDRIVLNESGRVLEMTTLGRYFTPAQRRALAARDLGCAFPGCDRPPSWADAHHIVYASRGGPTTVENGVLLCGPHHTEIHHGEWRIVVRDGVPWFIPPARLDPGQRPVRNGVHQAIADTRRAGQQLQLVLDRRTGDPPLPID